MLQPPRMLALALFTSALAVPLLGTPASAACSPAPYAASASADLVRLSALDLPASPAASGLVLGSATATMDGRKPVAVRASATALARTVTQIAPPISSAPATATAVGGDLGVARIGSGPLSARAAWNCSPSAGPTGTASVSIADLDVASLVRARQNLTGQAVTGLRTVKGRLASVSAAEIELADLSLLFGAVSVKVLKPPTLTATSTGLASTSSVSYQAPLLSITGPGIAPQQLSTPSQKLELSVPLLSGGPLASLVGDLPGSPSLVALRLSLGSASSSVSDGLVSASAASLRIQLLAAGSTLLDLGVGLLRVSAAAPCPPSASPSPPPPASAGCGGADCPGLPVTGLPPVAYVSGVGLLLLILGRFLLLLTSRPRLSRLSR